MHPRATLASVVFLMLFSSCISPLEDMQGAFTGEAIRFNGIGPEGEAKTKTVYSGQTYNVGTSTRYERLNWVEGDSIRIASASCPEKFADYRAAEVSASSDRNSSATFNPAAGNGLTWGEGTHDFYAVYPAPGTEGTDAALAFAGGTSATFRIPAAQVFTKADTLAALIRMHPDMNYAYMYSATRVATPSAAVDMIFRPLFTAFEITVGSDGENEMDLYSFYMTATQSISGTYAVIMNAEDESWALGTVTGGTNRIDVSLGGTANPTKVSKDKAVSFTVFAVPQAIISGVVLHFETSKGPRSLELKYSDDSWIEIGPGQKAVIEGLKIPGTVRFYTVEPIANMSFRGLETTSANFTVRSFSRNLAGVPRNERWKIEYSSDYDEASQTGSWSAASPSWLSVSGASLYDGSEETLTATLTARNDTLSSQPGEIQQIHTLILQNNTPVSDYDLSMHTIHGDTRSLPVTANSYVVSAPGTYLFPIVYGNAIDGTKSDALPIAGVGNVINQEAYQPGGTHIPANARYFLKRFLNVENQPIASPFIETDLSNIGALTDSTPLDAIALWQDGTTAPIITSAPSIVSAPSSSPLIGKCRFIRFTIDAANIRQGNIVIALRDISAGTTAEAAKIIWSWMIWVTDEELHPDVVETLGNPVQLMPFNLGWSDIQGTVLKHDFDARSCYVRISQIDGEGNPLADGASTVFKIYQKAGISYTVYKAGDTVPGYSNLAQAYLGSSPYYQFGRKDPFLGRDYTVGTPANIKFSAADGYTIQNDANTVNYVSTLSNAAASGSVDIGLSIKNPHIYYHSNQNLWYSGYSINSEWAIDHHYNRGFHNMWNAYSASRGDDVKVRKTVYDPCPPDFCLPRLYAFTGFTSNGGNQTNINNINGVFDDARGGYYFNKKKMVGSTKDPSGGTVFFCRTGLRRYGTLNSDGGAYKDWGAYWTAERGEHFAIHLVMTDGVRVSPQFNTDGQMADSWSIRPALEEAW